MPISAVVLALLSDTEPPNPFSYGQSGILPTSFLHRVPRVPFGAAH